MYTNSIDSEAQERPENKDGPWRDRSITDFIFCIVMLVFWAGCIAVMIWAFASGNPNLLTQVYDFQGTPCGLAANGTEKYPYAYFYQPIGSLKNVVCLSSCPTQASLRLSNNQTDCFRKGDPYNQNISQCQGGFLANLTDSAFAALSYRNEVFLAYDTTLFLNRFCVPSLSVLFSAATDSFQQVGNATAATYKFEQYISDVKAAWKFYLVIAAIAVGLSVFALLFTRCCIGVIVSGP